MLFDSLRRNFKLFRPRLKHGASYIEELEAQCASMMPLAVLLCSFIFLPYIVTDSKLFPELRALPYLRAGLTVTSLMVGLAYRFMSHRYRALICGALIIAYVQISTAVITGLTRISPEYMGGYFMVLMMLPILPLPVWLHGTIVATSVVSLFASWLFVGLGDHSASLQYSLNDLVSALVIVSSLIYIMNKIRYRSWDKSRTIEKLLLNILPSSIADELEQTGYVLPRKYESVTIVFTDFAGFTRISESLAPEQLIEELHQIFQIFDGIMERHGLEKLKTIGDSYMYAGGIPELNQSHAVDSVLAALEMQGVIHSRIQHNRANGQGFHWKMRLGMNSGSVMAGVVGAKKYVYDVFGNSVNLASRMESSGEVDEINISESTAERVRDFFRLEPRGEINARNVGLVKMFFVKGIRAELSLDRQGLQPNAAFFDLYGKTFGTDIRDRFSESAAEIAMAQ
ncbi:MAG TPA: adenylate/guanylate cyclase domain-containing protein [Oligoflexus sp.]|uniref:adenylate/guanylate cyclase domain-containing protein n=1 Tax=Oligoflexus sp. TaxID=1971216 RepID=UPI002D288BEC|nr:adenylate/guanylate cyclase domain-containing protein [Oligoflexus sp.]HYX35929.1 adenylate/guanylate cyclase domain-containing protein [Oligoflexus sp.]